MAYRNRCGVLFFCGIILFMICDICQKNNASVHLTEIINDKVIEMHICQACAAAKALKFKDQLSISNLLGGFIDKERATGGKAVFCGVCGLTYADFKKYGRFGCANCYTIFKNQLVALLKSIHGSTRYMGKTPAGSVLPAPQAGKIPLSARIKEARAKLLRAVELENYEEAARLRDEIKKMEDNNSNIKDQNTK